MKRDESIETPKTARQSPSTTANKSVDAVPLPPLKQQKKPLPRPRRGVGVLIAVFIAALVGGMAGSWLVLEWRGTTGDIAGINSANDGNKITLASEESISKVANEVSPSVVSILTDVKSSRGQTGQAAGTGIIVSSDGYIMTNKHVISDATNVSVTTTDGTVYDKVKIVGSDPLNDVAFLKIENARNLKAATIGKSSTLQKGQSVVAIGNSLGEYRNTITSGIVSGLGRPVAAQSETGGVESLTDLIQTDAAINPGNSGGPLVNLQGQVVGINTAVADANGIGFAIPIDATKGVLQTVLKDGKVVRAYIGVRYVDITPAVANQRKLPVKEGALVTSDGSNNTSAVIKGSPADKAGLKDGDIITKVNNIAVGEHGSISSLIAQYTPGTTVTVTYIRDKKEQTTQMTLGAYDDGAAATTNTNDQPSQQQSTEPNNNSDNSVFNGWPFGF